MSGHRKVSIGVLFTRLVVSSARNVIQAAGSDALLRMCVRPSGIRYSWMPQPHAHTSDGSYRYGITEADPSLRDPSGVVRIMMRTHDSGEKAAYCIQQARVDMWAGIFAGDVRICSGGVLDACSAIKLVTTGSLGRSIDLPLHPSRVSQRARRAASVRGPDGG